MTQHSVMETARSISEGERRASDVVEACLADISARDPQINSFTAVYGERALREAEAVDARRARGEPLGRLAGVPYAVKNLFDVEGEVTIAGAKFNRNNPAAERDSVLGARMAAAGAVLVGALNMDENAYGFTTENTHYGPTHNPHDLTRVAGGSSGGSAAAVAAGLVPLTLGSDTNGSIRVPSSLCGIFGLKPTYGRLPRTGTTPFVHGLDHLGPFGVSAADLALVYDVLQGYDMGDASCSSRPVEATLEAVLDARDPDPARIAILGDYFEDWASPAARQAVEIVASALEINATATLASAEQVRSAAFVITGSEAGALYRSRLQRQYDEFEPLSRDRLVAGSLIPASWYVKAQQVRLSAHAEVMALFEKFDILIAAATPVCAPRIGTEWIEINGHKVPARPSLGLLSQPISCLGLPVCTVPVWPGVGPEAHLPIGVQLIAAPWREDLCLWLARRLEALGVCAVRTPAREPVRP